jgi:hypothetical protein
MAKQSLSLLCVTVTLLLTVATGFVLPKERSLSFALDAKKKSGGGAKKGFGKVAVQENPKPKGAAPSAPASASVTSGEKEFLQSVSGGSAAKPKIDESVPVGERTASLLRNKYGLRTMEEQQEEEKKQEAVKKSQKKLEAWQTKADAGGDFDIMQALPAPVLIGIDYFLKAGTAICTVLFVLAGVGITFEAWSKASNSPLPDNIDAFIVNTIEPNFTPGLLVLLGFSVSLGAFAAAQISSSSSTYREDR